MSVDSEDWRSEREETGRARGLEKQEEEPGVRHQFFAAHCMCTALAVVL